MVTDLLGDLACEEGTCGSDVGEKKFINVRPRKPLDKSFLSSNLEKDLK